MRTLLRHPKSARLAAALLVVIVFGVATTSGCGPAPLPTPTATATSEPQGIAGQFARDIVANVGQVSIIHEGDPDRIILAFEETHNSRVGQIEIAIMLNRLHNRYGLKHIGLEGALAARGSLDSSWFHPSLAANQTIGPRQEVAVRLLEEGEISSAELMTLVYPDVVVHGIEKAEEYEVELSNAASTSLIFYLLAIAEKSMTQDQIRRANELATDMQNASEADKPQKVKEYIDYVIGTNAWTKERYEKLNDKSTILSVEELVAILDGIETKAAEVGADIQDSARTNFRALKRFYEARLAANDTMVSHILLLADKYSGTPVALTMGAAHTAKVSALLTASGVSYAVIRPLSLATSDERGDLSRSAYDRKLKALSVDEEGSLGQLLDNRRKPPPSIPGVWARSKADLYYLTVIIADAAERGEPVPFSQALANELPALRYVKLDPNSIKMIGNDVLFSVEAQTNDPSHPVRTIWVRTRKTQTLEKETLEQRLFEAREEVKQEPDERLVRPSRDTIAMYAPDQATIEAVTLGG